VRSAKQENKQWNEKYSHSSTYSLSDSALAEHPLYLDVSSHI
jgi:hypothetical protein